VISPAVSTIDASDFRCPRCGSGVEAVHEALRCANPACAYGGANAFPSVRGQPVLIDFQRSIVGEDAFRNVSRFDEADRSSSPATLPRPVQFIYSALTGKNPITKGNADKFLSLLKEVSKRPTMLVVGGGTIGNGMDLLYADPDVRRWAFDIYPSPFTSFVADGHNIPLRDDSVDGVWVQAVLEHVLDPGGVVAEIHRVLRPNGVVYSEIPFMQQVHEGAYDFTRFTMSGHRWLFRRFDQIEAGPGRGPGTALLSAIRHALAGLFRHKRLGTAIGTLLFFWVRFLDGISPRRISIDAASGTYFLGRKADQPLEPKAMAAYYGAARKGPDACCTSA
jgi:SAM-dependent methyltransferase